MAKEEPYLVPYAGDWVALAGGRVAGTAPDAAEAERLARRAWPDAVLDLRLAPPVTLRAALDFPGILHDLRPLLAGKRVWLVGGAVRDMLLGRRLHDLDFATQENGLELARKVANRLHGAFYALDAERGTGRAVLQWEGAPLIVDFAALRTGAEGPAALQADLAARDFALNAMALPAGAASVDELIDPLGGREDLLARRIRATGPAAIRDDPNRALRALRQAAELNFSVDAGTLEMIRRDGPALARVAAERRRDEFFKLLAAPRLAENLRRLDAMGLLAPLVPEVEPMRGVEQGPPHFEDVLAHTFTTLGRLEALLGVVGVIPARPDPLGQDQALDVAAGTLAGYAGYLREHLAAVTGETRTRRALLAFAALLHDCGKPATQSREAGTGRVTFPDHERAGAALAVERARALRLNAPEITWCGKIVGAHMLSGWDRGFGRVETYRYFRAAGAAGIDAALLALADQLAAYARQERYLERFSAKTQAAAALLDAYIQHYDEIVAPPVLLDGRTLMARLGLEPGPRVGELLEQVREAQAAGEVTDRGQALELVRRLAG